jgi:hypothetical protein
MNEIQKEYKILITIDSNCDKSSEYTKSQIALLERSILDSNYDELVKKKDLIDQKIKQQQKSYEMFKDLKKLGRILDSKPDQYIDDELTEFKRQLQLDSELVIAHIKQSNKIDINTDETTLSDDLLDQINKIKDKSELMIEQVDRFQIQISSYWLDKQFDKEQFDKDFTNLKNCNDFILNYLFEKKLIHNCTDKILDNQQNILDNLTVKVKNYLFNNNSIELRSQTEEKKKQTKMTKADKNENSLNYFIQLTKPFYFDKNNMKEIELDTIFRQSLFYEQNIQDFDYKSVDILNDGLYFLKFAHEDKIYINLTARTYLSVFDPVSKKILKEKMIHNNCCKTLQINNNNNLIALDCFNRIGKKKNCNLVIINSNLEIVREKNIKYTRDSDESFIFVRKCSENKNINEITILDWSLNEIKSFEFKQPMTKIRDFKYLKDKFIVKTAHSDLKIFDSNYLLLKEIEIDNCFIFSNSNENIILLQENNNKLIYLNLNGDLLKKINLIDYKIAWQGFKDHFNKGAIKFGKNDEIALILDYSRLVIFN